jgi:hypothetical protein
MTSEPGQSSLSSYKIAQLEAWVTDLQQDNKNLHAEISQMKADDAAKERQLLMVGITTLGGIVVTLFGVLWTYRSVIFK